MFRFLLAVGLFVSAAQAAEQVHYVSDDIVRLPGAKKITPVMGNSLLDEDCKAKIKEIVCVVEAGGHGEERPCEAGSEKYASIFERIHDRLPEYLQKMYCRVSKIYIEKELRSTAYAAPWNSAIGIRQSLLDEKLTFAEWATWKEQLTFGGSLDSYATKEQLPTFVSNGTHEDFVMNVVIHEFGHLFDFANELNGQWTVEKGSYAALSWKTLMLPLPGVDFPNRREICFYDCEDHPVKESLVETIYNDLYTKTNFLNTYTSRNAREDFADTFAFVVSYQLTPDLSYILETRKGKAFDFKQELAAERMKTKVKYISDFIAKDNLQYP